ncbi:ROK family protein [Naasia sp. SYSU D00057]|uniref:ROK family protein n=1 Tax=Naasia sp. SYSU D00057 TaxID=2817380 RepID=UPI001B301A6C|nr:ROK family protein [Naasia sp. SYSU D00057]
MSRSPVASSPQLMRAINSRRVLAHAWGTEAFTASQAIGATGLTRSTVIDVCEELVRKGWLAELGDARAVGDYRKGRPAKRYALRERAAVVVGVDAGYDRMSAVVADLRGGTLARTAIDIPAATPQSVERLADADTRLRLARRLVDEALPAAGVAPDEVLAITVAVPAPVDDQGVSPYDVHGFWPVVNPGFLPVFAGSAPLVTVENDANLAAIAEGTCEEGSGRSADSYVAMLVGEGIGAGLMIDGRLVRGRRGGAGEMRFLDRIEGVGSPDGLARLARVWATEAIRSGSLPPGSELALLDPGRLGEADVAAAAEAGDAAAIAIVDRLADRLARICLVLGDLLDVDVVVVGGAAAQTLPAVIGRAGELLAASVDPTAPRLVPSRLGASAVAAGAVEHALERVREHALELDLPGVRAVA